jgi:hypothetical protein
MVVHLSAVESWSTSDSHLPLTDRLCSIAWLLLLRFRRYSTPDLPMVRHRSRLFHLVGEGEFNATARASVNIFLLR